MKQILTAIILLSSELVFAQSFEGTLTYIYEFEIAENLKKMGIAKETIIDKMKEEGSYFDTVRISYKQGNYFTLGNNNGLKSWTIYNAAENKIYTMQDGEASDICSVTDASVDAESAMTGKKATVEKLDTTVLINGNTCRIVRVKWKSGTYDYYYMEGSLTVEPGLFARHTYEGWAEFLKISNSLPVRIVKTANEMLSVTLLMVSSKAESIDEKLFSIPELVPDKSLNVINLPGREIMRIKK